MADMIPDGQHWEVRVVDFERLDPSLWACDTCGVVIISDVMPEFVCPVCALARRLMPDVFNEWREAVSARFAEEDDA